MIGFIIFILLLVFGCYVTYKETKHRELRKIRTVLENRHQEVEGVMNSKATKDDIELKDFLRGELAEIERSLVVVNEEDVDRYKIEDIENDLKKIKKKIDKLFD